MVGYTRLSTANPSGKEISGFERKTGARGNPVLDRFKGCSLVRLEEVGPDPEGGARLFCLLWPRSDAGSFGIEAFFSCTVCMQWDRNSIEVVQNRSEVRCSALRRL